MKLRKYIKDKWFEIFSTLSFLGIGTMLFCAFRVQKEVLAVFIIGTVSFFMMSLCWDFFRRKKFYDEFLQNIERLDKKYLVIETLKKPGFYEGELLSSALYEINKSMCENVNKYRCETQDFKEYLDMWVHEIKIPIASLLLMCHNHSDMLERKYLAQIRRLDNDVDRILYYSRLGYAENDYLIKMVELKSVITKAALRNKDDLLDYRVDLHIEKVDGFVYTDAKWLEFVLNQIIQNSIKYRAEKRQAGIWLFAEDFPEKTVLHIKDNGIGILEHDLPKVFQKAFTGENGRINKKSTGMGLYIVKQLCQKLGHSVEISSKVDEYTDISISFGKHQYFHFDGAAE